MPHQFRGLADGTLGDPRHFSGATRRPVADMLGNLLEADGVFLDESMIEPVVLDHQVQNAVEQGDVTPRFDGQEQVAGPRGGRDARIDHDDFRPVFAGLPDVMRRYRSAFGDVGAADPDDLGLEDVGPRVGGPVDPERLLVGGGGADHAQAAVVVDVGRLQTDAGEFTHQVGFFRGQAGAAQHREGGVPMGRLDALNRVGDFFDRVDCTARR